MSEPVNIEASDSSLLPAQLHRSEQVVLVIDLVESVRLMQADEAGLITRWLAFVQRASDEVIPKHRGRLVKSLGDGLMASFDNPRSAVQAALAMHNLIQSGNRDLPGKHHMFLRAGINSTEAYVDDHDIYGIGVNLVARLATLAGPGETIVSANVRDGLTDGLDVVAEDLGECYLKHVAGPTRAYRVGATGAAPVLPALSDYGPSLRPTIAVVPFESRRNDPENFAVGELIADGVIVRLSHARNFRVVSRLSTTTFRGRQATANDLEAHLGATYVLTGSYYVEESRLLVSYELCDVRDHGAVVKADRIAGNVADLLQLDSDTVSEIVSGVHDAIFQLEVHRVQTQPLPTLQSYSLLLGGIHLLHRSAKRDFEASFAVLEHLVRNHPRSIEPRIWQAKWYALRAVQGLTVDRAADTKAALTCTAQALAAEPTNSFALAMEGFVHCHLSKDYDAATTSLKQSVAQNPSETFGHLFNGVTQGLMGSFDDGIASFQLAMSTSPLDPAMYLFNSIGAYLYLGAHRHDEALVLAKKSLRQNREHAHTWRILTVAQVEAGQIAEARISLRSLLKVQPELTVTSYLANARINDQTRRRFAESLRVAGLPVT